MASSSFSKLTLALLILIIFCNQLITLQRDGSELCNASECSLDTLPRVLGDGEATLHPQKDCYGDAELVNVTCSGDLKGPSYNKCLQGTWKFSSGPTCVGITQCSKPNVPANGSASPDTDTYQLYTRIYFSCNTKYSLLGPSEAVCESGGVWNPSTVPTCKAGCLAPVLEDGGISPDIRWVNNGEVITYACYHNFTLIGELVTTCRDGDFDPPALPLCYAKCSRPVLPNSDGTSPTPLLEHRQSVTVTCNSGYSYGNSYSATSVCNNGTLEPSIPFCQAQCSRPMIPNSDATLQNPHIDHGGLIVVSCNAGYSNGQSQSTTSKCMNGVLNPVIPLCYAQCERPIIPHSDSGSIFPALHHGQNITVTCDSGYSSERGKSMTSVCKDGALSPPVPRCFAQCDRPVIPHSDATASKPAIDHGDAITVTCNSGYSNGQWILSTTSICNHGTLIPAVPFCYAQCRRPVIANSDAASPYPELDQGGVIVVTCDDGYSNGKSQSAMSVCNNGTLKPIVPSCYAQCKRPVIPNSDATSSTPAVDHGSNLTVTCASGYSNGKSKNMTSLCINGTLNPATEPCYAQCSRPVILKSDSTLATPFLHHGDTINVTCNAGYSYGISESMSSQCYDGTLTPDIPHCSAKCNRPVIPNSNSTSPTPLINHGEDITVTCNTGFSNGQSYVAMSVCDDGTFHPPFRPCYAHCNRQVVPNSDATSEYPVLQHGEEMSVRCTPGYSIGHLVRMTTLCSNGTLNPPVPSCYAQCNRPEIPNSNATSLIPPLNHGDAMTVTCNTGYSNGHSVSTTIMCSYGELRPSVPSCYAQCTRPIVPNSNSTFSVPAIHHGDNITVTCNGGYSNGQSLSTTSVCDHGTLNPVVPPCNAQCSRPIIRNSDANSSKPLLHHGDVMTVACSSGYSFGQAKTTSTSQCIFGVLDSTESPCYAQCYRPIIQNSDATSPLPLLDHGEVFTVTCDTGYSNGQSQSMTAVCTDGVVYPALSYCYAQCNRVIIANSDATSSTPSLHHGEVIAVTCNVGYTNGKSESTTSICSHGKFTPPLPHCYAECTRPVIPNSDATSSTPPLQHGEILTVTCNQGFSNWQSQVSTSMCSDGDLKPDVPLCYAQCSRPIVPNSDATSSFPLLHNGDTITVTCDNGYTNENTKSQTLLCDRGLLDPPVSQCYAQCSRPIIPHSDAISSNPALNHGETVIVKCHSGYSNGQSQTSTSVCSHGTLNPPMNLCFAQCNRPVIANSDATSPYPLLNHGEIFTATCDVGYSNGQFKSMTSLCTDGIVNIPSPFCYAQCSRLIILNSDATSSSPPIHHGEALFVTCDEGYSTGEVRSTISVCSNGIFSPSLPTCYANCRPLQDPDNGVLQEGLDPFLHREVAVFTCLEDYSLVGSERIYCYDGLWDHYPPECLAFCHRPVIPNSDATSPTPLVPHGIEITVTCNDGYTNGDNGRTVLICNDGTLSPDEPFCTKKSMESQDVAGVVLGVLGTLLSLVSLIADIILAKTKKDDDD